MIGKQVGAAIAFEPEGEPIPTYSTVVRRRHALNAQSVRHTPTILQIYVPKRLELRITIGGDGIFPAAIDPQNNRVSKHDWHH